MDPRSHDLWTKINRALLPRIGEARYNIWVRNVKPVEIDRDGVVVSCASVYVKEKMADALREPFVASVRSVTNRNTAVRITVDRDLFCDGPRPNAESDNGGMTFDTFIVGDHNRLAYKVAKNFTESGRSLSNLLIICGSSGMGKTHLLHSIRRSIGGGGVVHYPCEHFARQYLSALRQSLVQSFRQKCRTADALLIDDLQLLTNKVATQEELSFTLDELDRDRKKIAVTCDALPKDLCGFSKSIRSRLKGGLVVKLERPDYPSRLKFLSARAGKDIPVSSLEYIAASVDTNMKDLVVCLEELRRRPCRDVQVAGRVVEDFLHRWGRELSLDDISRVTAASYGVKVSDLLSAKRSRTVTAARHACFFLARKLLKEPLAAIGIFFGGRSHTTVLQGCRLAEQGRDPRSTAILRKIERDILSLR